MVVGSLVICRAIDGNAAQMVNISGEWLPIPEGPLPDQVIGFETIWICYVDQSVIEFLQRIRQLFDSGTTVKIYTSVNQSRRLDIIRQNIWPLVNDNIRGLSLDSFELDRLRQFSPAILCNCANLRSIQTFFGFFPEFPAEDNAGASSRQALAKWLFTPRGDGLPKMLDCDFHPTRRMGGIMMSFVNASESVNFIIRKHSFSGFVPFDLKNDLTREQLTFGHFNEDKWLLVRCPIGREEDKWTNWETESIELNWDNQWNRIEINFKDGDIGDGMVGANEGPSDEPTE